MLPALIAMTVLGCNDSLTKCEYVDSPDKHWDNVAQCDAEMEKRLQAYSNIHFPSVIAVCEPIHVAVTKPSLPPTPAPAPTVETPPRKPKTLAGYAGHVMDQARHMLPTVHGVKRLLSQPVHFVSSSYAWVARRLQN